VNRDLRDFVSSYLRQAPLFAAVVRGVECALLREAEPFAAPVLDLGCGDGLFAKVACSQLPDVGLDPGWEPLQEAASRNAHRAMCSGSATELPFPAASFQTIICNSVIEHIPDLEGTLAECHRVLQPGGRLLITTPSHHFGPMLLGSRALRGLGMRALAERYARWFNAHSLHFHTDSLDTWQARLSRHGFAVNQGFYYLSPGSHGLFDLMHYLSAWRWVRRKATGRWVGDSPLLNRLWAHWILKRIARSWPKEAGPYLFLDATRETQKS
jgi:SAM-dependent methyltransferase